MTFGAYISRQSPIHALSAQTKLLSLTIASVLVFFLSQVVALLGLLLVSSGLLWLAKLPFWAVWLQLRSVIPLLIAILLIQGLLDSWQAGVVALLRFAILILLATIVTLTTRVSDLVEAIEQALQPLRRFGVRPGQVSFMLALSIRLVPLLLQQFHEIQEAQRARGLDRNWLALLVPLVIKTLRMADDLSEALDARGFDGEGLRDEG
jgi:biotin transport system permease protein